MKRIAAFFLSVFLLSAFGGCSTDDAYQDVLVSQNAALTSQVESLNSQIDDLESQISYMEEDAKSQNTEESSSTEYPPDTYIRYEYPPVAFYAPAAWSVEDDGIDTLYMVSDDTDFAFLSVTENNGLDLTDPTQWDLFLDNFGNSLEGYEGFATESALIGGRESILHLFSCTIEDISFYGVLSATTLDHYGFTFTYFYYPVYGTDVPETFTNLVNSISFTGLSDDPEPMDAGSNAVAPTATPVTSSTPAPILTPEPEETTVYWTPNGKAYHSTEGCRTLSRSKTILSGTVSEAIASGHGDPCDVCH